MSLSHTHFTPNARSSSFFMDEQHSFVHTCYIFFIPSSIDEHLGCFHDINTVSSGYKYGRIHILTKNVISDRCKYGRVHFLLYTDSSLIYKPRIGRTELYGTSAFWYETLYCLPQRLCSFILPTSIY